MRICCTRSPPSSTRPHNGSSGLNRRTTGKPLIALAALEDALVDLEDGGIDMVPVHGLGEFETGRAMDSAHVRIARVVGQGVTERIGVAGIDQGAGFAVVDQARGARR